jgi:hypothetical protein
MKISEGRLRSRGLTICSCGSETGSFEKRLRRFEARFKLNQYCGSLALDEGE